MPTTNSHPTRRERALRAALGAISPPPAATSQMGADPVEPEQRQAMIREAAYFLAGIGGSVPATSWKTGLPQRSRSS